MKGTIDTLERSVVDLSKENQEIKRSLLDLSHQNLEMKQVLLKLCSHSRWQENLMSQIARKHDINPEAPEGDCDSDTRQM